MTSQYTKVAKGFYLGAPFGKNADKFNNQGNQRCTKHNSMPQQIEEGNNNTGNR